MSLACRLLPASALVLSLLLGGCATQGPTTVSTAQRSGQGWVVTRTTVAAQLLQACPDGITEDIQDLFAPSRAQIDQLEAQLHALDARLPQASQDDRQYVGVIRDQQAAIFIRGLPARDHRRPDPARNVLGDCHSGWEALFNPANGQFEAVRPLPASNPSH